MPRSRLITVCLCGAMIFFISSCGGHFVIVQPMHSLRESWPENTSYIRSNSALWVETERNNETAVAYGDFNRDGFTDVVMGKISGVETGAEITLLLSGGSGELAESNGSFHGIIPATIHARKILAADFNLDGVDDFLILDHGYDKPPFPGAQPWLVLSTGSGLEARKLTEIPAGFMHSGSAADIDSDGDVDVFVTDTNNSAFFLINDGHGNFTFTRSILDEELFRGYYTSELIDLDRNGFFDLIVAGHEHEGAASTVYWGSVSGKFTKAEKTILPAVPDYAVVLDLDAADLDNNGIMELVLTRTKSNPFYEGFYLQILKRADSQFTDVSAERIIGRESTWIGAKAEWIPWIKAYDFDQDGDVDLVVDDQSRNLVWLNDGSGRFTMKE
jgi:hypothetical protein